MIHRRFTLLNDSLKESIKRVCKEKDFKQIKQGEKNDTNNK